MAGVESRPPIDLDKFRAGRHWRVWGRNWQITRCTVYDDAAGTIVSIELKEATPVRGTAAIDGHGPFYAGRHSWAILGTEWSRETDGNGLRVHLQRTEAHDRPHPIIAAFVRLRSSR